MDLILKLYVNFVPKVPPQKDREEFGYITCSVVVKLL